MAAVGSDTAGPAGGAGRGTPGAMGSDEGYTALSGSDTRGYCERASITADVCRCCQHHWVGGGGGHTEM